MGGTPRNSMYMEASTKVDRKEQLKMAEEEAWKKKVQENLRDEQKLGCDGQV